MTLWYSRMAGSRDPLGWVGVVEHDLAAGQLGDEAEGRENRGLREIGNDAEPEEERAPIRIETGRAQRGAEFGALKIARGECEMRRRRDAGRREPSALLRLRRGMIDLEHAQFVFSLEAIGERVEPGAEHDDLPRALFDRLPRRLLGDAAPRRDEKAQPAAGGIFLGLRKYGLGVLAQDGQRERIGENAAALENLMRRTMAGGAECGARELA